MRTRTVSDNGRLLAAPGIDGNIRIYDFTTGRLLRTLRGDGQPALVAAFNHDASLVATGSAAGKVTVWRVATGKPVGPPVMAGGTIVYGIFDPTGDLFTVSDNGTVARWDLRDPERPDPDRRAVHGRASARATCQWWRSAAPTVTSWPPAA